MKNPINPMHREGFITDESRKQIESYSPGYIKYDDKATKISKDTASNATISTRQKRWEHIRIFLRKYKSINNTPRAPQKGSPILLHEIFVGYS